MISKTERLTLSCPGPSCFVWKDIWKCALLPPSRPLLPDMIQIPSKPCDFSRKQLSQQQRERRKKKLSLITLPIMNSCSEWAASMCFQSSADGSLAGGHFQEVVDIMAAVSYWQELLSVFLPVEPSWALKSEMRNDSRDLAGEPIWLPHLSALLN